MLDGELLTREVRDGVVYLPLARSLEHAHGVSFLCPKCYRANGGARGVHSVLCWFRGRVPDDVTPGPGRWDVAGTGLHDLTLSPSIQLAGGGCDWHGFVRGGAIVDA